MKTSTLLKNLTFFTKDAEKSAQFFIDVFGLKINQCSINYSELVDNNNFKLIFMKNESEAYTRTAFNPLLTFNIDDFDSIKLKLDNYNVEYDGEIKDNEIGKYACIKTTDGIMCMIFEPKHAEIDYEEFNLDINEESKLDPNSSEIRNILDKIKL